MININSSKFTQSRTKTRQSFDAAQDVSILRRGSGCFHPSTRLRMFLSTISVYPRRKRRGIADENEAPRAYARGISHFFAESAEAPSFALRASEGPPRSHPRAYARGILARADKNTPLDYGLQFYAHAKNIVFSKHY